MYALPELQKHMEAYARRHPQAVLLVRADRQVSMQAFLDLCDHGEAGRFQGRVGGGGPAVAG
ncbi:MAG: hypothetical protein WDM96_02000 [Lacunisphaera sp.]